MVEVDGESGQKGSVGEERRLEEESGTGEWERRIR